MEKKIAFIHGRPASHPIHASYAKKIHADFYFEDRLIRWQDIPNASKLRRYFSWMLNAFLFQKIKTYDIYFCEGMRVPQLIMKRFGLMKKGAKLVALMADESLYFLSIKKYPKITQYLIQAFLNSCDSIICIGDLQFNLAKEIIKKENVKIFKIYNGINDELLIELQKNVYRPNEKLFKMFVFGHLAANWRAWYKGADIAIDTFCQLNHESNNFSLDIIGQVEEDVKRTLLKNVPKELKSKIHFLGNVIDIVSVISKYDLCLHVSRGDAFPTSTLECMAAGIPVIVSNITGTSNLVKSVSEDFVVNVSIEDTLISINRFINMSVDNKHKLSLRFKEVVSDFKAEKANSNFQTIFNQV